jgi:uncharacterized protein
MIERTMTREECHALIDRTGFGRLACARDNQPYIVPINFASDANYLYGFSTVGKKIEWMRSNPLVCVEVDDVTSDVDWASVVLRGRYEELPEKPECLARRRHAQERLVSCAFPWWPAFASERFREQDQVDAPILYCIHIDDVTGRQISKE